MSDNPLFNLHFYPDEVVSRYRDPQLHLGENINIKQIRHFDLRGNNEKRSFIIHINNKKNSRRFIQVGENY